MKKNGPAFGAIGSGAADGDSTKNQKNIIEFQTDLRDFVNELLVNLHGCKADHDGVWRAMNSPNFGVSFHAKPWHHQAHEHGWCRWALPGLDGVARSRFCDSSAPWCELSPSGAAFLHFGNKMKRVGLRDLLETVAEHAAWVGTTGDLGGAQ